MNTGVTGFHQFFLLVLIAFAVALIARRLRVPYALALVITGLVVGIPRLLPKAHLDPAILMTVFLPPLLFESALNLHIDLLKRDWRPIAIYTLAGTIASTLIIGVRCRVRHTCAVDGWSALWSAHFNYRSDLGNRDISQAWGRETPDSDHGGGEPLQQRYRGCAVYCCCRNGIRREDIVPRSGRAVFAACGWRRAAGNDHRPPGIAGSLRAKRSSDRDHAYYPGGIRIVSRGGKVSGFGRDGRGGRRSYSGQLWYEDIDVARHTACGNRVLGVRGVRGQLRSISAHRHRSGLHQLVAQERC